MTSRPITTSVFDLFKVGPGPSSSHTIGPMKAAFDFRQRVGHLHPDVQQAADAIHVHLYGSLGATGKGHGTDRAVVAGLLGWQPETTDPAALIALLRDPAIEYPIPVGTNMIGFGPQHIHFERKRYESPYANTLVLRLTGRDQTLAEEEYYSTGGGFIIRKGEPDIDASSVIVPYPYSTMTELKAQLTAHNLTLDALMMANEMALTGRSLADINARVDRLLTFMHKAVRRGLRHTGVLPGSIKLSRKAPVLYRQAKGMKQPDSTLRSDSFLIYLNAYCLAASEENAAGGIVVTAPTSGASGVIPGLTYLAKHHFHYDKATLRAGMLAAAMVGFLVKHNASISGAEMGCMGEIGTASAMGAAFLTRCAQPNGDIGAIEAAAEIGIEHHLGMTCDPIGGYVQIPCIERNAMGAVKAYNAYLLATSGAASFQKISLDAVIKVMKATGRDMSTKYKETSEAGLALSATEC